MLANVQAWINSAASNYGWIMSSDEVIVQSAKRIFSATNPVIADRPTPAATYNSIIAVTLKYVIMNAHGRKLAEKILTGNYISLPLSLLPGVYNLQVWQAMGNILSATFVKK